MKRKDDERKEEILKCSFDYKTAMEKWSYYDTNSIDYLRKAAKEWGILENHMIMLVSNLDFVSFIIIYIKHIMNLNQIQHQI